MDAIEAQLVEVLEQYMQYAEVRVFSKNDLATMLPANDRSFSANFCDKKSAKCAHFCSFLRKIFLSFFDALKLGKPRLMGLLGFLASFFDCDKTSTPPYLVK
jgi:hypothetical protein